MQTLRPLVWKYNLPALLGLLLMSGTSQADADGAPASPQSETGKSADVQKFLQLARTERAFQVSLDLKVENASVEEIVGGVRKAMRGRKAPLVPHIEVRDVSPTRLSFDRKDSTAGGILNSIATLAGAQVWFFSDYVLIAPEESLSSKETTEKEAGTVSSWAPPGSMMGRAAVDRVAKQKALSMFVSQELQGVVGNIATQPLSGKDTGTKNSSASAKMVSVNQLSSEARSALQELVVMTKDLIQNLHQGPVAVQLDFSGFALSEESQVGLSPQDQNSLVLNFSQTGGGVSWDLDGRGISMQHGKPSPPSAPSVAPFDPSAGKS